MAKDYSRRELEVVSAVRMRCWGVDGYSEGPEAPVEAPLNRPVDALVVTLRNGFRQISCMYARNSEKVAHCAATAGEGRKWLPWCLYENQEREETTQLSNSQAEESVNEESQTISRNNRGETGENNDETTK